jgi:hypothetical protein
VASPLDDLLDATFDEFVPSVPDCMLSDYDDGGASDDEANIPESNPGNAEASQWGSASASDYEVVRKGGVRKSARVEAWGEQGFR